ncbi:hypothetical protein AB0E85_11475 [Streptomyces sp. NPDC029044]|uniref:hypothetical protein n=1 Tax=Streptomyces sp. NPDC029044 TaxID=3157198 RepID=UPI0033F186C9
MARSGGTRWRVLRLLVPGGSRGGRRAGRRLGRASGVDTGVAVVLLPALDDVLRRRPKKGEAGPGGNG